MRSMPEVDMIDSKHIHVDAMTEKGEVTFAKECKRLLDLCDEIGTKSDKKHAKHKAKALLRHKYYRVHKEEEIIFNSTKSVYKILNNQDKVTMKHFYHKRCDTDLERGFCDMQRIPCACNGCVKQLSNPWITNLDKTLQPRYAIEPIPRKYSSILCGYNKCYICQN